MTQPSASLTPEAGFALEMFIHTDPAGDAAAELSTVTALHGKTCARWYFYLCVPAATLAWVYFVLSMIQNEHSSRFLCMALTQGQVLDDLGGVNHRGLAESQRTCSFSTVPLVLCHGRANPKSSSCQFKGSLPLFLSRGISEHY